MYHADGGIVYGQDKGCYHTHYGVIREIDQNLPRLKLSLYFRGVIPDNFFEFQQAMFLLHLP